MTPTKIKIVDDEQKPGELVHLIHVTSGGKPLCGNPSPDALIGSYSEHLDGTASETVRWVREIFDSNGKTVPPCPICLSLYPPVFLEIVPFDLTINLHFKPSTDHKGYNIDTKSFANICGVSRSIDAFPDLIYFSARWLGSLTFSLDVDANSIVPLVEYANKTKK